jgi:transcription elongation GreA/GreB family factor
MNSSIHLNEDDESRLIALLAEEVPPPRPTVEQCDTLKSLLSAAPRPRTGPKNVRHVAFYDAVTLRSISDPSDSYEFEIVMPQDMDIDSNRLSICMPISLGVIGRPIGSAVVWNIPSGERHMRIETISRPVTAGQN